MMPLHIKEGTQRRWFCAGDSQLAIDTVTWNDDITALLDAVLLDEFNDLLHVTALILGADRDWLPAAEDKAMPLTHSISLSTDVSHRLALYVPDGCLPTIPEVVQSLGDVVLIEEHRQPVSISFDIPQLDETEVGSMCEPGSLLLLGDGTVKSYAGTINAGSHRFSIPLALDEPVLDTDNRCVLHSVGDCSTEDSCDLTEIRLKEQFAVDVRELIAGSQISIRCNLYPGTRLELVLKDTTKPGNTVSGTVVRIGQSLAFKTDVTELAVN